MVSDEQYECSRCRDMTRLTDFHYQEGRLYYTLKETGLCENCNRRM